MKECIINKPSGWLTLIVTDWFIDWFINWFIHLLHSFSQLNQLAFIFFVLIADMCSLGFDTINRDGLTCSQRVFSGAFQRHHKRWRIRDLLIGLNNLLINFTIHISMMYYINIQFFDVGPYTPVNFCIVRYDGAMYALRARVLNALSISSSYLFGCVGSRVMWCLVC